jgi:hypothetical protein
MAGSGVRGRAGLPGRWAGGWGSWRAGFAVRLDWPDGTHDLGEFRRSLAAAQRRRDAAAGYWRRGPLRPVACSVVVTSRREVRLHARRWECRSPDCPTAVTTGVDVREESAR